MFTTTVTYKDFNDKEHTEKLYFHLMVPEFADLQFNPTFEGEGGLGDYIKVAMKSGDMAKIYTFFKLMIVNTYGRRSEDGSEFRKSPEFTEKFLNSRAYEEFFVWLIQDPKNAELFWKGIVPERVDTLIAEAEKNEIAGKKKITELSKEELVRMLQEKTVGKALESSDS